MRHEISISEEFRELFKRQQYEKYVYMIICRSKLLFKGKSFERIEYQSHGECDFKDEYGNKYDVKLLFNKKQGAMIGERKNDIINWLKAMDEERAQFSGCIMSRNLSLIVDTQLYKITKERLLTVSQDEDAIFFIPFPIVIDCQNVMFMQFASDYLQVVYDKLEDEGLVGERKLYFIYPSVEPETFVLRSGNSRKREYIKVPELRNIISFETFI